MSSASGRRPRCSPTIRSTVARIAADRALRIFTAIGSRLASIRSAPGTNTSPNRLSTTSSASVIGLASCVGLVAEQRPADDIEGDPRPSRR